MDVESELVELRLLVDGLKRENERIVSILSEITNSDVHTKNLLKILYADLKKRYGPVVEDSVRCMYG